MILSNGSTGPIERHHPRLDALVASDTPLEVVADMSGDEGAHWLESPTRSSSGRAPRTAAPISRRRRSIRRPSTRRACRGRCSRSSHCRR